jgi:excisionase family DNA binding protein
VTIPVLYTPEEVALQLKTTRRTVYRWLTDGSLRGLRAGDAWRISDQDINAFLESRKSPSPRVGPRHPDYQRWLKYFTRVGIHIGENE